MGYGVYRQNAREFLFKRGADSARKIFKGRGCHEQMKPRRLGHRESLDSRKHPHSWGIALALDVTGSMGAVCLHAELVLDLEALATVFKDIGLKGARLRAVLLTLEPFAAALHRERAKT